MNLIEELVKKYEGKYSEEAKKGINFPSGKITFQPQLGVVEIDGTRIAIGINALGGAARTAEPYRIVLYLDKNYETEFEIYPKTFFAKITEFIISNNNSHIPKTISTQYRFKGNEQLIRKLGSDKSFCEKILNDKLFIFYRKKYPKSIVLTPSHGIKNLDQFEKFLMILKLIERHIKGNST